MVSWQEFPHFCIFLKTGSGEDILVSVMVPWAVNADLLHNKGHREGHLGTQQGLKTPRPFTV